MSALTNLHSSKAFRNEPLSCGAAFREKISSSPFLNSLKLFVHCFIPPLSLASMTSSWSLKRWRTWYFSRELTLLAWLCGLQNRTSITLKGTLVSLTRHSRWRLKPKGATNWDLFTRRYQFLELTMSVVYKSHWILLLSIQLFSESTTEVSNRIENIWFTLEQKCLHVAHKVNSDWILNELLVP